MHKEKKNTYLLLFILLVIIAFGIFLFSKNTTKEAVFSENEIQNNDVINSTPINNSENQTVVEPVPVEVDPYEELKNLPLTKPDKEEPRGTNQKEMFKYFSVEISNSGFSPKNIVIGENDLAQITFKSQGALNIDSPLLRFNFLSRAGEDNVVVLGPLKKGAYLISCKNQCPPTGPISAYIVVK